VVIDYPPTGVDLPATRSGALVNYPNPFNPSTMLTLRLPFGEDAAGDSEVRIDIFTVSGERVRALYAGALAAAEKELVWDGRDDRGAVVPSGVYIGVARTEHGVFKRKMIAVR
jgi:flagellar hook assembly protein FlgD